MGVGALAIVLGLFSLLERFLGLNAAAVSAGALALVCTAVMVLLRKRSAAFPARCPTAEGVYPECLYVVHVSADDVRVTHPQRATESVALSELDEVQIVTNDSGPFGADVWWLLLGRQAGDGCTFPAGATGAKAALRLVQALPGFDNELFVQAMGSTSNARFSCWRRNPTPSIGLAAAAPVER